MNRRAAWILSAMGAVTIAIAVLTVGGSAGYFGLGEGDDDGRAEAAGQFAGEGAEISFRDDDYFEGEEREEHEDDERDDDEREDEHEDDHEEQEDD